ncbi:hypothetical protein HIM_10790 [Hirsutella minnesotensis 3608]|uniref:Uncharacterized protein n=1 Tax=Hirsutella minnesotensis 3608 TaxID=1043627 RepID=A0A0F7ZFV7_9HYPO|nr:hypothetical protein HIM_10790 [Hirsutella minnesotensis 3608]
MARIKGGRRGAPAPNLKLSATLRSTNDPTSPPETPTARKAPPQQKSQVQHQQQHQQIPQQHQQQQQQQRPPPPPQQHQHHHQQQQPQRISQAPFYRFSRPLSQDPNIKPVGNGHQFSYRPALAPEQLSPQSSSSDPADDSDSDLVSSSADEQDIEARSIRASYAPGVSGAERRTSNESSEESSGNDSDDESGPHKSGSDVEILEADMMHTVECGFIIEDIDPMDSECEGLEVLFPTEIESTRSISRPRHKDLDRAMMQDLKNLNCSNEASDNDPSYPWDDDEEAFLLRRQELRRHRRVSLSSSFGKRTHSELSDSDNDDDGTLDVNEVGSSARRMRKRLHRSSLLFQDPPEPRIDELEEPDSSDEGFLAAPSLAQELPYYTMEIMEMESS